jgi:hypothetical protein
MAKTFRASNGMLNKMDATPIILASIAGIISVVSLIIQANRDRHKTNADALSILEQSNARMAQRLATQDERIDKLETQTAQMAIMLTGAFAEVDGLRSGVNLLTDQLRANGLTPVWTADRVKAATRGPAN